jgi:hypothetical protein
MAGIQEYVCMVCVCVWVRVHQRLSDSVANSGLRGPVQFRDTTPSLGALGGNTMVQGPLSLLPARCWPVPSSRMLRSLGS